MHVQFTIITSSVYVVCRKKSCERKKWERCDALNMNNLSLWTFHKWGWSQCCNKNLPIPICNSCDGKIYYFHYIYFSPSSSTSRMYFCIVFRKNEKFSLTTCCFHFHFHSWMGCTNIKGKVNKKCWCYCRPMLQWTIF
jgi:hypothetical protein